MSHYTLSQLLTIVEGSFDELFGEMDFWFVTEVGRVTRKGRFVYFDLVETDEYGMIQAKARGMLRQGAKWFKFLQRIKRREDELAGVNILCRGKCRLHREYGFGIHIDEFSPEYTIGQQQVKQQTVLEMLTASGIVGLNKMKDLAFPPLRVAVISNQQAQGFVDFQTVLEEHKVALELNIYESAVHGNIAKQEVLTALQRIVTDIEKGQQIDMVVIVRGGGESSGIAWQEDVDIGRQVCQFPVPVMVAVGHTMDQYVLDKVAKFSCKTPTDAGYVLVEWYQQWEEKLDQLYEHIQDAIVSKCEKQQRMVERIYERIVQAGEKTIFQLQHNVNHWYESIMMIDPIHLTKKGYGLLYDKKGKTLLSREQIKQLGEGDEMVVKVYEKEVRVNVI